MKYMYYLCCMIQKKLFKFPMILIDGHEDEQRRKLTNDDNYDTDYIVGEAEVPYYEFLCVYDRWKPITKSLNNAYQGKFDCCSVNFGECGIFLIPWSKERFKREFFKFTEQFDNETIN